MEEIKMENELKLCGVKRENLGTQLEKLQSHSSDILLFSLQWKDLDDYLKSAQGKVEKRFKELALKETELQDKSFALEERAKVVESAEADLEKKSNAEELRLTQLRAEHSEMVESLRKTQVEIDMKGEQLAKMEVDVSAEMENLDRTQSRRRELDDEIERKRKEIEECGKMLETRSSELVKTQGEIELNGKQLGQIKIDLERSRSRNRELEEEIERKRKDLKAVIDEIAECEKKREWVKEEVDSQQKLLEKRSLELVSKEKRLNEMMEAIRKLSLKIESEGKTLERAELFSKQFSEKQHSKEKLLDSTRRDLEKCITEYDSTKRELRSAKDKFREYVQNLETKEKELKTLQSILTERNKQVEEREKKIQHLDNSSEELSRHLKSKQEEVCAIDKEIKECSGELEAKRKHRDQVQSSITDLTAELKSKERDLDSFKREMQDSLKDLQSKEEEQVKLKASLMEREQGLKLKEKELDARKEKIALNEKELDTRKEKNTLNEKELDVQKEIKEELKSLQSILAERNKQVEEIEKKIQRLDNNCEELIRELKLKQEDFCAINKAIKECSGELEAKRKLRDELEASLMEREQGLELKEKELDARKEMIALKEKDLDALKERIDKKNQELKSTEQKLATCVKGYELKAKKLSSFIQQSNTDHHDLLRDANVSDDKTLQLLLRGCLKKCPQLYLDVSRSLTASPDPAKLVLDTIQGLYSAHQRSAVTTNLDHNSLRRSSIYLLECLMDMSLKPKAEVQEEAIRFATAWKNTTLVNAENPVEVLGFLHFLAAFSLAFTFSADKVQNLFDVAFLCKYAPSLCNVLGVSALAPVNNVLSLDDKPEQHYTEVPISNSSDVQENIANEDALRYFEGSASFAPNEVSTKFPMLKDPGRFVLSSVEEALKGAQQRKELVLAEPIVKTLVPLLEELCVASSIAPDLQSDATKLAHRWSRMIGANAAQTSELEAWAFLQFIVAYGLVKKTKVDETLQFASYVAHFKEAPRLFQSLGLSYAIPNFVQELLKKALYIPAIRFMFFFNVKNDFYPLEYLKDEIINLRRSAKEEAEVSDAVKMRDIIELIQELNLNIDLPADLILKFMVPREIQNQNQCVAVSSSSVPFQAPQILHMQDSHTVIHNSYISTHGSNPSLPQVVDVETYQVGGSAAFQGQSSYHAGFKRQRMDPRPTIRPCFNPPSGYGRH